MKPVKVHLVDYGRRYLQMRYVDPDTGKQVLRSTKTRNRQEATKAAGVWEDEINTGRYRKLVDCTWQDFRDQYRDQHLSALRFSAAAKITGVLNCFEEHAKPFRLSGITAARIATYQTTLRNLKRSEATIRSHTAVIAAALRWAASMGMLNATPKIPKVPRAKVSKLMKGRPITDAELKTYLDAVPKVLPKEDAPNWQGVIEGLWLSGLRVEEAVELYWDRRDKFCIVLDHGKPKLLVSGDIEKSGKDRLLPLSPEFAEWLLKTPKKQRAGRVFRFPKRRRVDDTIRPQWVSKILTAIGREAGIIVDEKTGKRVSAHDLRRSFGDRWARRVMPVVLMELMRHSDISTTLRYYVGQNAEATANILWEAHEQAEKVSQKVSRKEKTSLRP